MHLGPVIQIANGQHGVITHKQALWLMTSRQLYRLIANGELRRVHPATYVVNGFPDTWVQRAAAATFSIEGSVLSHFSAARLWGFDTSNNPRISVLMPGHSLRTRTATSIHCTEQLMGMSEIERGVPTTSVPRTLIDVTSHVGFSRLERLIDEARRLKLVTLEEIAHYMNSICLNGRPRLDNLHQYMATNYSADDDMDTRLEVRVLSWIRDAGYELPLRQHWYSMGGNRYRADLSYVELKLDIEPDGPHHRLPSVEKYDQIRDADFRSERWDVLRVPFDMPKEVFLPRFERAIQLRSEATSAPELPKR